MFMSPTDMGDRPGIVFGVHVGARKTVRFSSTEFHIYEREHDAPIRVTARVDRVQRGASIDEIQKTFEETASLVNRERMAQHFGLELTGFALPRRFVLRCPSVSLLLGVPYPIPDMYYRYLDDRGGVALVSDG